MPQTIEKNSERKTKLDLAEIAIIAFREVKDREKNSSDRYKTLKDYKESCNWSVCHCATYGIGYEIKS